MPTKIQQKRIKRRQMYIKQQLEKAAKLNAKNNSLSEFQHNVTLNSNPTNNTSKTRQVLQECINTALELENSLSDVPDFKFNDLQINHCSIIFNCQICNEQLDNLSAMYDHLLIHARKSLSSCSDCGLLFIHEGDACEHSLEDKGNLHCNIIVSNVCRICNKFVRRDEMSPTHIELHSYVLEIYSQCIFCYKYFKNKQFLLQHMNMQHFKTEQFNNSSLEQ